jgi:RNA polymerase sigma factor (sigma-70 family)
MSKIVSNADIMDMFKSIDDFKTSSDLPQDKIDSIVTKKQDDIINKLSFLVYNQARQYRNFPNYDDVVQEGFIGLLKAVRRFKWERFPNFFVFSDQWIRHYVKRAASRFDVVYNPNRDRVVYAEPGEDEADPDGSPDEILWSREREEGIGKILNELPERDKIIVCKIFGLGGYKPQTLREIRPLFGLSHERIRQIKNSVLGKLKKNQELQSINELNQG